MTTTIHRVRGAGRGAALALALLLPLAACEPNNQGYAPTQPIAYSHAVHAGGMKIPCGYCHTGAERGRFAGIPAAQVCMNCHSQVLKDHPEIAKVKKALATGEPIRWARVHELPDHVTFEHRIHVTVGRIACQTCHGPIQEMGRVEQFAPLTMGWCLECHRRNAPGGVALGVVAARKAARGEVSPAGEAGAPPFVSANRLTDCAVCHH